MGGIQEAGVRDESNLAVWVLVSIGTLFTLNCVV